MLAKFTLLATLATASALKVSKTSVPKPVLKLRGGEIDIPTVNLVVRTGPPLTITHAAAYHRPPRRLCPTERALLWRVRRPPPC